MPSRDDIEAQIAAILESWGMRQADAAVVADVLSWADLRGIDSHGISMLTLYDAWRRDGRVNVAAEPKRLRDTPVALLVSGEGGLGHVPARMAMQAAIDKARVSGLAIACVRGASHYGACGYYTAMAADAGLIGISTTSTPGIRVPPTGAAQARLGTDPLSFAAPAADGRHFLLDMATTTVAFGKIRNKANEGVACPPGWILDSAGRPSTDPLDAVERGGFQTPLGGTPAGSSHKGYGLAVMVNILSSCLSGAALITDGDFPGAPHDLGHFFLVIDPGLFRDGPDFAGDVADLCEALRATTPLEADVPVLVAGDPERATAERRGREGIVIPPGLAARLRAIAEDSGVAWRLG